MSACAAAFSSEYAVGRVKESLESTRFPDDTEYMVQPWVDSPSVPAQQAASILKAWVRQDRIALRRELHQGLRLCAGCNSTGGQEEQFELLQAVSSRWDSRPAPTASDDPVVRLCVSLLAHLASQS